MKPIAPSMLAAILCAGSMTALSSPSTATSHAMNQNATSTRPTQSTMAAPQKGTAAQTTQSSTTQRGPTQTGQPGQDCESLGNQPGNSMSAPGSAFNPDGKSGSVYAGEQTRNSRNTASVSQYDVACARPSK